MNKASLLLIPLILSIGIVGMIPNSVAQTQSLEECRDGLIIVFLVNGNTFTCKEPVTAERWVELGIAQIVDPNYVPTEPEEEPKKLSIFERIALKNQEKDEEPPSIVIIEDPEPEPELLPFASDVGLENKSETAVEKQDENKPEPPTEKAPENSNANPLPGTPRKVGQQGVLASGYVVIEIFDDKGNKKYHREDHNLVVDVGLETLADLAFGTTHSTGESAGGFTYISVGTGGTAPAAGNTDCETQHGAKKQDVSVTNTALGAIINVSWVAELGAGSLQEICLTDDPSAATGNLFSRQTFTAVPIVGTDTVNAEWTITFADSNGT